MENRANQISRITLAADPRFLRAGCHFMREMALAVGLDAKAAANLELAVEEAGLLIINQSFEGPEDGTLDIVIEYDNGRFIAAFEDKGLPFDWSKAREADSTKQSVALLSGFADELKFINRGREGKRLEFVVHQSSQWLETSFQEHHHDQDDEVEMAPLDTPIALQPLDPDKFGVALTRCMYAVYGYSYAVESVYFPERLKSMIDQGVLMSFVAVTPDGEVAAHQGFKKAAADARVANMGMGMVDPRYRGRRLFERLKDFAVAAAKEEGLSGLYIEAVTIHPYSQRANFAVGGRETGILLAYVPEGFTFKKIKDGEAPASERQTAVLFYNPLHRGSGRTIYPPLRHKPMIERIFAWVGIERTSADAPPTLALPEHARIDVEVVAALGQADISVLTFGQDLLKRVEDQLEEFKLSHFDLIYVDLPLADPAAQAAVPELERLGFFFAGIYPEKHADGDLLRLQFLNNIRIDPSKIHTVSEMGKDMLDYVMAEMDAAS